MRIPIKASLTEEISFYLGMIKRQQYLEALDRYRQFLSKYPQKLPIILTNLYKESRKKHDNLQLKVVIAEILYHAELYQDAKYECEEILELSPSFSQAFFILGKIYKKTNNPVYVSQPFKHALDQNIFDSTVLDILPKIYLDHNNLLASIELFEKIIAHFPDQLHYHKILVELYKSNGLFEKSIDLYLSLTEKEKLLIPDACKFIDSVIIKCKDNTNIYKKACELNIKNLNPDKSLDYLQSLIQLNFDESYVISIFKELIDIFPGNISIFTKYIEFLISKALFTDALMEIENCFENFDLFKDTIFNFLQDIMTKSNHTIFTNMLLLEYYIQTNNFDEMSAIIRILFSNEDCHISDLLDKINSIEAHTKNHQDELQFFKANCYYQLNQIQKAESFLNTLPETPIEYSLLMIKLLDKQNHIEQAFTKATYLLNKYPLEKELYRSAHKLVENHQLTPHKNEKESLKDIIYFHKKKEFYKAIDCCQQIKPENELYFESQLLMSRIFFELGSIHHSINQINRLKELIPHEHTLYESMLFFKGTYHFFSAEYTQSIETFEEILAHSISHKSVPKIIQYITKHIHPQSHYTLTSLIQPYTNDLFNYCVVDPSQNQIDFGFSQTHNNNAVTHFLKKNTDLAKKELVNAIQMDPNLDVAYNNLAILNCNEQDFELALFYIDKAIELNKNSDVYLLNKGVILIQTKEFDLALSLFQKANRLNRSNFHTIYNISMLYFKMNRVLLFLNYYENYKEMNLFFIFYQRLLYVSNETSNRSSYWTKDFLDLTCNLVR